MLKYNLMVKEEVIMIHSIFLNNHFHFHQIINKHVNEMDILRDVIYIY
jgi:hypothetical protein